MNYVGRHLSACTCGANLDQWHRSAAACGLVLDGAAWAGDADLGYMSRQIRMF